MAGLGGVMGGWIVNELSLFTGAGGGLLGTHLLGWTPIGYVEFNDYCQRVIAQRIKDAILPDAPIFGDIKTFISEGYAESYKGMVDVITAGFPCQPFSVAGKQQGADDDRNMWPATIATIRAIRPRFAFLENVPGLITSGYFPTILGDLAESGYDARWCVLGARHVGAHHKRDRLWLLADTDKGRRLPTQHEKRFVLKESFDSFVDGIHSTLIREEDFANIIRDTDAVADWVDRFEAVGNGQVPAVVAKAWSILTV